ncbi:hypothetical protein K2173_011691 [Erythroxylum novogranatense]|uniref:Uncharacterized protein n=1 Tax=Erythroxylum novogranatense TaxID=1862640 RepID=A0AAV8T1M1_9ROSI|nr:hypothetical protein K2173_011691 [Erythroxylum novogranatense]
MDRISEKEKSSKRSRDDCDHKHRSRDKERDRDDKYREDHHHHHHHSNRHRSERESHRDRHKSFTSSSRREDRESSRDGRELSHDDDSEGSRDERERSRKSVKREDRERSRERSYDAGEDREGGGRERSREREVKRERSFDERESDEHEARKKRPRRRFGDKVKEEDTTENDTDYSRTANSSEVTVKQEVITRSHEVPGKSSTDGTSSTAGKSGSLSLDALAKAKRALQIQKELSEKLKKIPLLNKGLGPSTDGSSSSGSREGSKNLSTNHTTVVSGGSLPSSSSSTTVGAASAMPPAAVVASIPGLTNSHNIEAVKRAQELAAKMGFRQDPQFAPLINLFPGQVQGDVAVPQKPTKAPVLRVDALGREIDEHGNIVNVTKPSNLSTLKTKRMTFQFVEEGKWSKEAEMIKLKSQFGEERAKDIKARQALHAKAKSAPDVNPNLIEVSERVITKEKPKDPIPEVEWWDVPLLRNNTYGEIFDGVVNECELKMEKITIYVEHPRPIEPPAEPAPPPPQPLKLTKKEQKSSDSTAFGTEKDRQEMIRQGLLEPPKPKVKMSNLMKVLGSEATQDPTRLEKEIHTAAAEREQAHIDRNIARKLTPAERREKKERKLFDDPNTLETIVSVYRINDLSHKKTRFKVDVNAQENRLTGTCVMTEGINVVVVEGGSKAIKRYGKLMLRRINWAEAVEEEEEEGGDETEDKPLNKCVLVWQGSVAKPSFHRFSVHECVTEAAARKVFADAGVAHYWDLAVNFSDDLM